MAAQADGLGSSDDHETLITRPRDLQGNATLGFGQWLQALAYALSKPREIAIIGDPNCADTQALPGVVRRGYRPFQAIALGSPDSGNAAERVVGMATVPLLQDRGLVEGQAAAYVCRDFTCQAPIADPEVLRVLLEDA